MGRHLGYMGVSVMEKFEVTLGASDSSDIVHSNSQHVHL